MSGSVRVPAIWSLPWHTLRLAGRCFLPLLIWFSIGQLIRFGLLVGATEVSHGSAQQLRYAITMAVFVIMVLASLIVNVGMFYSLRNALIEMRARARDGDDDGGFFGGVTRVIAPYAALYVTWGWHLDDVRAFLDTDITRQTAEKGILGAWGVDSDGHTAGTAMGLLGMSYTTAFVIMSVAFVLRYLFDLWYESKDSRPAAFGTAICELVFFFYGLQVVVSRSSWVEKRSVTLWWKDLWSSVGDHVPGWRAFWDFIGEYQPFFWDAVILPAAWLTLAILVYGAYAEDAKSVVRGTRLESAARRMEAGLAVRTHMVTRQLGAKFFAHWAHWLAIANTLRLTVRGGAPLFGLFALCFVGIRVGEGYAWRGLVYLIGNDHPFMMWNVLLVPVDILVDFGVAILTTCLLAATFDLAATRDRARRAAAVSDRSGSPTPGPISPRATAPATPGPLAPSAPRR